MADADIVDGEVRVRADWREKKLVEQVPGLNYRSRDDVWHGRPSWALCQTLRGVFGADLEVGPSLAAWARAQWYDWVEPNTRLREEITLSDTETSSEAEVIRSWR